MDDGDGVLRLEIRSNGSAIDATVEIASVHVQHREGEPSSARIGIGGVLGMVDGRPLQDLPDFAPGAAIRIEAGYADETQPIFEGVATTYGVGLDEDGLPVVEVDCVQTASDAASGLGSGSRDSVLRAVSGENVLDFHLAVGLTSSAEVRGPGGRVKLLGAPDAVVGGELDVHGFGERFDGRFVIRAVTHELAEGSWTTEVGFGWPAREDER